MVCVYTMRELMLLVTMPWLRCQMQAVTLDRSLATAGASGGCASRCECISPHFIPLSQLVLLTLKVGPLPADVGQKHSLLPRL